MYSLTQLLPEREYTDEKYLGWLRGGDCEICGREAEPHHCNGLLNERGMAVKNDYLAILLCREHHEEAHRYSKSIWAKHNIDPMKIIIHQLIAYIAKGEA